MVSLFCEKCKRHTMHYWMRLLGVYECDDCGAERKA